MIENGVREQTKLSLAMFRKIVAEEADGIYDAASIQTADDVAVFFLDKRDGLTGKLKKDVIAACLKAVGIEFDKLTDYVFMRDDSRKDFFFKVFAVEGAAQPKKVAQPVPSKQPKPQSASVAPVAPQVESVSIDWSRVARMCGAAQLPETFDYNQFDLYDELPITAQDDFCLMNTPPDLYLGGIAILRNDDVIAEGHLEAADGVLHVVCTHGIQYSKFRGTNRFMLLMLPRDALATIEAGDYKKATAYRHKVTIHFHELDVAENNRTLCIDFGTSNTTVGSYGILHPGSKEPELVQFPSSERNDDGSRKLRDMIPTLVYVRSCKDPDHIEYLFGYDARDILERDFQPHGSLFPEIKRWMATMDATVQITDEDDNTQTVTHREIIQAYLEYVIHCATQYFKCRFQRLHFSAPVKLKTNFIEQMQEMFDKSYKVYAPAKTLDEGVAIVYDNIRKKQGDKEYYGEDNKTSVLIMDCGGGTTDLAHCHFYFEEATDDTGTDKLFVRTRFENGDSNFGGNNITFRILQMLKIKIAAKEQGNPIPKIQDIISATDEEVMDDIDLQPIDALQSIYADFEKQYKEAEVVLPTRFGETKLEREKARRRRNFYYLWHLAEKIKVEFYKTMNRTNIVEMDFDNMDDVELQACIDDKSNYYLYDANAAEISDPLQGIHITIKEVERAICPDLYALINKLLCGQGKRRMKELVGAKHYELSGQSCKITMFHNLLKEFVPGQSIRRTHRKDSKKQQDRFKVSCVAGSIRYTADRGEGGIMPKIDPEPPQLIYQVYRKKSSGEDIALTLEPVPVALDEDGLPKSGATSTQIVSTVFHYGIDADNAQFLVRYQWQFDEAQGEGKEQQEDKRLYEYSFSTKGTKRERELSNLDLDLGENYIRKLSYLTDDESTGIHEIKTILDAIKDAEPAGHNGVRLIFLAPDKSGYGFLIFQVLKTWEKNGTIKYALERAPEFVSFEDEELESFFNGKR